MHDLGLFNRLYRLLLIVSPALLIAGALGATPKTVIQFPHPGTPVTLYDIPVSQAITITREAIQSAKKHCGAEGVAINEGHRGKIRVFAASYTQMLPIEGG